MARRIGSDGIRTHAAICEAAVRLIAQVGYEALSMRRLGEEIGLGAAAIYRYFPTKQAILFNLLERHMLDLLEGWKHADVPGSAIERLEAFTRFHIRYHWSQIDSLFISYMELRSLSPENFDRIEDLRNSYERGVVNILQAGVDAREFVAMDCRVTARAVIALLNGLTTWYRADGPISPDEIENMYWKTVARVAGVPEYEEETCLTPA